MEWSKMLCVGVGLALCGSLVSEGGQNDLVDVLREKGVLSKEEAAQMTRAASEAGALKPRIGGRIMVDAAVYDSDDVSLNSGTEFRRVRLFAKGRVAPQWFYKLQYDFTDAGSEGFRDVYLGYDGLPGNMSLKIGQTFEAGCMEDTMSSKYITFMERALPVLAFSPATRRMGLRVDTHGSAWHAAAGVFGDTAADDESEEEGTGVSVRACVAPVNRDSAVLHLGASGQYRSPRGDAVRFRARPEAHVDDTRLVDSGSIEDVSGYATYGFEAACVQGPFSMQGEYIGVDIDRDDACSIWMDGFYVYASWLLTGESRPYDASSGEFGRLKPSNPLGEGGYGAWELALRYSELDLDDEVGGGEQHNVTAGINWYVSKTTRLTFNYVVARAETEDGDVDADIAMMRAQVDF